MPATTTKRNGRPATPAPALPLADVRLPSEGTEGPPWDHGETDPDGRPWFRHELFPLELTPPETVLRWWKNDRRNADKGGAGCPEVLMIARWDEGSASWVELPGRWSLASTDRDGLMRQLGAGRYMLTAYSYLPGPEGAPRKLAAVRGRGIQIGDLEPADAGDDDDQDDDDQDAEPIEPAATSPNVERQRLELEARRMELAAEESRRRDGWKREEQDRRERLEAMERRSREEREERDKRDRDERDRWREHQRTIVELQSRMTQQAPASANPIADAIMPILVQKALEFIQSGGGEKASALAAVGSKLAETFSEAIVEIGAPLALAYAKRAGVDMTQLGYDPSAQSPSPSPSPSPSQEGDGDDDGATE